MAKRKVTQNIPIPKTNEKSKYDDLAMNKRLDTKEHQMVIGGAGRGGAAVDYTGSISNAVDERNSQSLGVNKDVVD
ncbi:MAG: hypothetical protein HY711_03590 [Candidatus Melainabacteria bacterium]|nr:hypothetical protein [Candidatus Melainabacteria bacterium]